MTILEKKRSQSGRRRGRTALILLSLLAVMSGLAGITLADDAFLAPLVVDKTQNTSDNSRTRSEGLLLESPPTYIEFDGSNGLQLKISLPRSRMFDYTLMFWVRSKYDYA